MLEIINPIPKVKATTLAIQELAQEYLQAAVGSTTERMDAKMTTTRTATIEITTIDSCMTMIESL